MSDLKIHQLLLLGLLAFSPTLSKAADAIPQEGLVTHYSFEEKDGPVVQDASPRKNQGRLIGGIKRVPGRIGQAVESNESDGFIAVSQNLAQWLGKTGSLSFWIKTETKGEETNWLAPAVAGIEEVGGSDDCFWGWIDQNGKIGLQAGDGKSAKSKQPITDGKWHHVVLTRDMNNGAVKIYIDGKLDDEQRSDSGPKTFPFHSFGRRENTGGDLPCYKAAYDEIRVYNRVLMPEDVVALFKEAPAEK